jgi:hypothetical protein
MRSLIVALVGSIAVTASTHGAFFVSKPTELRLGTAPPGEQAAQGCGWGPHRSRWGNWDWGDCVPDGGVNRGPDAGSYYSYPGWRMAPPRPGSARLVGNGIIALGVKVPHRSKASQP